MSHVSVQGRPVKRRVKPPEGREGTEEGRAKIEEAARMWVAQRRRATHATSKEVNRQSVGGALTRFLLFLLALSGSRQ